MGNIRILIIDDETGETEKKDDRTKSYLVLEKHEISNRPIKLDFATSLEDALGKPVDRIEVLHGILTALMKWRPLLGTGEMIAAWNQNLAFRGKQVEVSRGDEQVIQGKILGINQDGSLRLDTHPSVHFGDVHLRPMRV